MTWCVRLLLVLFGALVGLTATAWAQTPSVLSVRIDGAVTPVVADHVVDAVQRAEAGGHEALLVEMDTPGGLVTSMREIVQSFLGADVPVIVYVTLAGGRAASAGALITFSSHVAAMAHGTSIGAATPVDLQGGEISDKVINDAAAFAESVARQRDRNVEFAEATVREGRAVSAQEAEEINAVDLLAGSREELLSAVDGRVVTLDGGREVTLRTAGAAVEEHEMGPFTRLLQVLADPNLAFLFLSLGSLAVLYELASPGAGLGGLVGAVLLILGFFALSVLPVNIAGLALLGLAVALFVAEVFTPGIGVFAGGGAIALVLAGLFLFDGPVTVSPAVLWPTALVVGGGAAFAGKLAVKARKAPPVTGDNALLGKETVVRDVSGETGRARVDGSWWNVRGKNSPVHTGERVRVVGVDELTLVVEPAEAEEEET